jgi:hypothetical protein
MRPAQFILAAAIAVSLSGCSLRGKPQTAKAVPPAPKPVTAPAPPAPPPKLSIPQTDVQLPPPQPVDPEALAQVTPAEEPRPTTPPATRAGRRPSTAPRQEPAAPAAPVAPPPQPAETDRPAIQELLPAAEVDRFQKETAEYKRETQDLLQQAQRRRLNATQQGVVKTVNTLLQESEAARERNDWRVAHELANRAVTLARELTGGK